MNAYRIPALNFPRLQEEVKKLNKRATKLKTEPVVLTILETVTEKKRNEIVGFDYQETYHICTVIGQAPKLSGWTFVAVIEPVSNGENLVREVPGQKCPVSFRKANMNCDHCAETRRRNSIFILKNENNDHKQVGRNCLADFLGHEHPESLLSRAEYMLSFDNMIREAQEDDWGRGGSTPIVVATTEYAITAAVVIRRMGWLPRSKAGEFDRATADIVWDVCTKSYDRHVREMIREHDIHAEERDIMQGEAAVEWAASIDDNNSASTYLHDLGVCCRQNYVDLRRRGFVASVIQAHQRVLNELQQKNSVSSSVYVGESKKRQEFNLTVMAIKPYMSGIYSKTLVKFVDEKGNVIIWRASGSPEWISLGKKFTVKATVKENGHSEFNGVKQTEVSRVGPIGLDAELVES